MLVPAKPIIQTFFLYALARVNQDEAQLGNSKTTP
jgi:hypothetical protein